MNSRCPTAKAWYVQRSTCAHYSCVGACSTSNFKVIKNTKFGCVSCAPCYSKLIYSILACPAKNSVAYTTHVWIVYIIQYKPLFFDTTACLRSPLAYWYWRSPKSNSNFIQVPLHTISVFLLLWSETCAIFIVKWSTHDACSCLSENRERPHCLKKWKAKKAY